MSDVEKAVFWIHDRKCRVLVFSFDGKVMDNDDTWNNLASAQSDVFHKYGYGVVHEHVARSDAKRIAELNAIFDSRTAPMMVIRCAVCKQETTRPGQWLDPDTFVCSVECKHTAMNERSYDDLAASGGIVDAPDRQGVRCSARQAGESAESRGGRSREANEKTAEEKEEVTIIGRSPESTVDEPTI